MLWKMIIKNTMHMYFKNLYDASWYLFMVINLSIKTIICPGNTLEYQW